MRVTKRNAVQVHPVPKTMVSPKGPFPRELFDEPDIVVDYESSDNEDGSDFPLGATSQNDFKPVRYLRCSVCLVRVLETETQDHVCEE
jgi:hypothetical protein